jgi:hypothetical protein
MSVFFRYLPQLKYGIFLETTVGCGYHTHMADVESPSASQPFCVWAQASRNFAIHVPAEVIGSLGTESLVAFKRVPRRGLETGGILLGRTESQGDTTTFFVEGFAPIESEHRFGPSYVLSDSDFAHLQTELIRNGTASIGIYRSQTRAEQLEIQDADAGLFEKCFGVSDALFLMLAPLSRTGAFYFREDGSLKCVHQFAVVSSLAAVAAQGRASSHHVNLPTPASTRTHGARHFADQAGALVIASQIIASQRSERNALLGAVSTTIRVAGNIPPASLTAPRSSAANGPWVTAIPRWATTLWSERSAGSFRVKSIGWVLAAVTLATLTANLLSYSFRHSAGPVHPAPAPSYLYLKVERAGPALRLLWDGNASAARGANRAVLHIQDGDQQSDRELTPYEFMAGQFTYQPQHSAVTFRLNTYAGEPNAIGLIQVMIPAAPVTSEPILRPAQIRPSVQPVVNLVAHAKAPVAPSAVAVQSNDKNDKKEQNIEAYLPVTGIRPSNASETSPPAMREPPRPAGFDESRPHFPITEKKEVLTSGRGVNVRALATPVPNSRWGRLFGKILLGGRSRKQAKAVEAVPAYQAQPIVRMPDNQPLDRPVAVGVKVFIGESGAVNNAEVVDYGDPLNLSLANAALAAAKNWTFEPSRVDDIPVASQAIIRFYFSP